MIVKMITISANVSMRPCIRGFFDEWKNKLGRAGVKN